MNLPPRRGRVALPSLGAGVLLALSLPPWGWWPLGLAGAGLFYWRLAGLRARTRVWSGWLAGLGCYLPGLFWARAFNWYGAVVLIALEALFFAAAAVLTPPWRGRAPAFVRGRHPGRGRPDDVAFRRPPSRRGLPGPGRRASFAAGPDRRAAVAHGRRLGRRGRRGHPGVGVQRSRAALAGRGALVLAGLGLFVLVGAVVPDGGPPLRAISMTLVQGGGQRGVSKEQVDPATVFAAQVRATPTSPARGRSPAVVLWPEDVISLSGPLRGSTQDLVMAQMARQLHATVIAGVTEPAGHARSATRSWSGPRTAGSSTRSRRCTGSPSVSTSRTARSSRIWPTCPRSRPTPSPATRRAAPHTRRTAGHPRLLRGLLRQPQPHLGPGRGRALDRPDQHVVVRHGAGADPGGRGGCRAGRRDRPGPGPGGAHGYSTVVTQRGVVLQRSVLGRPQVLDGQRAPAARLHPLRPLGRSPGPRRPPRWLLLGRVAAARPGRRRRSRYS